MRETIEIIISPGGQARLETKGYAGTSCQAASRLIEQALGQKLSETATPEAHQASTRQTLDVELA